MPGLDPGIHLLRKKVLDRRIKSGDDGGMWWNALDAVRANLSPLDFSQLLFPPPRSSRASSIATLDDGARRGVRQ
jgi:hypothetical protein